MGDIGQSGVVEKARGFGLQVAAEAEVDLCEKVDGTQGVSAGREEVFGEVDLVALEDSSPDFDEPANYGTAFRVGKAQL